MGGSLWPGSTTRLSWEADGKVAALCGGTSPASSQKDSNIVIIVISYPIFYLKSAWGVHNPHCELVLAVSECTASAKWQDQMAALYWLLYWLTPHMVVLSSIRNTENLWDWTLANKCPPQREHELVCAPQTLTVTQMGRRTIWLFDKGGDGKYGVQFRM